MRSSWTRSVSSPRSCSWNKMMVIKVSTSSSRTSGADDSGREPRARRLKVRRLIPSPRREINGWSRLRAALLRNHAGRLLMSSKELPYTRKGSEPWTGLKNSFWWSSKTFVSSTTLLWGWAVQSGFFFEEKRKSRATHAAQRTLHVGQHDGFAANVDSGHALTSNPCHQGGIHQHCELQGLRVHGSNSQMGFLALLH